MKYLKLFEQFLILEAELKSSQFLQTEIEKTYNEAIEGLEEEQKERASKKGVLSKVKGWFTGNKEDDEVWAKFFEEEIEQPVEVISCKVNDVIYDRPKLQLGAVIFNKGLSNNFKYDKDFISLVNSVVTSKKMTEELKTIYDSSNINLAVNIFYKPKSNGSLDLGSISSYTADAFIGLSQEKESCGAWSMRLNIYKDCREEIKDTIRHELQHLTQKTCSLYLAISENFIKEVKSGKTEIDLSTKITDIYLNSQKKSKVGVGKTLTGTNQNGKEESDIESLKVAYKKVYNDDLNLDSKEEMDKADWLQYVSDDTEYKPWLSDKVNIYVDKFSKKTKIFTNGKSIDDCAIDVVKLILDKDEELILLKKLRKEAASDLLKLVTLRIKKLGLVK